MKLKCAAVLLALAMTFGNMIPAHADVNEVPVTAAVTVKPDSVTGLKTASSFDGVTLSWNAAAGTEGYLVYGKRGASGQYGYIGMTTRGTTFFDKEASAGEYSFYWVFAYYKNTSGKMITGKCEKYTFGKKNLTPAAVRNLKTVSAAEGVKLTWDASDHVSGYLIYGKHGSTAKYGYIGMTTKGTSFTDKKALNTDWNFYWVFPYYEDENGKKWTGGCPKYVYGKATAAPVHEHTWVELTNTRTVPAEYEDVWVPDRYETVHHEAAYSSYWTYDYETAYHCNGCGREFCTATCGAGVDFLSMGKQHFDAELIYASRVIQGLSSMEELPWPIPNFTSAGSYTIYSAPIPGSEHEEHDLICEAWDEEVLVELGHYNPVLVREAYDETYAYGRQCSGCGLLDYTGYLDY